MRIILVVCLLTGIGLLWMRHYQTRFSATEGAPPYDPAFDNPPEISEYDWLLNWKRPEGPVRVGLQVGHWKNNELPDELERLRGNTGSAGGGKAEWEVNKNIAEVTAKILEEQGVAVDILPATIPVKYFADAFAAIHADGNLNSQVSGYKVAAPRRDFSGKAGQLAELVEKSYGEAVPLKLDPNVSRNMRGYYAFAWWRREHAVHPMTPAIIIETGFLTSPYDRKYIVGDPDKPAEGIARGILQFLKNEGLISN